MRVRILGFCFAAVFACLLAAPSASADDRYTLKCSSDDKDYHACYVGGIRSARLVRQISGSPCIEGRTWGVRNDSIWVDKGCRAEFEVRRDSDNRRGWVDDDDWRGNSGTRVYCASNSKDYRTCHIGDRRRVRLVRQVSGSPCIEGRTWGVRGDSIWVDKGCRAEFEVRERRGRDHDWRDGRRDDDWRDERRDRDDRFRRVVTRCSSDNGRYNACTVGNNRGVRLVRQISGSPCTEGRTWGVRGEQIWVDKGCRAEFEVLSTQGWGN